MRKHNKDWDASADGKAWHAAHRKQRIAAGYCGNCGMRRLKPGCESCIHCLQEKAKTQIDLRQQRREKGVCPECGGRKQGGRWGCPKCVAKRREATRRYKEKKHANQAS